MYWKRNLSDPIKEASRHFPVLLATGPRQTGKTELLRHTFPHHRYVTLDALDVRQRAERDPRAFFVDSAPGLLIDEIQEAPGLLPYVKEFVDRNKTPGQVVLTGSHQFHLMQGVTESLSGRVAIFQLLPFSWPEIAPHTQPDLANLLLRGMYPQLQTTPDLNLDLWFSSYINTYLERDLRSQIAIRDLRSFEALLQLLAARIGQELNMHKLAAEVGVKSPTIKEWISALEAAFVIYLLPPYFQNFGKRVVRSPKIYFVDTGLACHLLKIRSPETLISGPMAGPLFENFIIQEFRKAHLNQARQAPLYFWRSHDGLEVDLLVDQGEHLQAIEIKLTHTVTLDHVRNLLRFQDLSDKKVTLLAVTPSERPALSDPLQHKHWTKITGG